MNVWILLGLVLNAVMLILLVILDVRPPAIRETKRGRDGQRDGGSSSGLSSDR